MARSRILVVEDVGIIAEDIRMSLVDLGYEVPAVAMTGEQALRLTEEVKPDLILMDVVLQGRMDGIETATAIRARADIPIIYLTAYSDDKILERAKITQPFAYLTKPFRDRELHSCIEMALFKHRLDLELSRSRTWLSVTLQSIGDAVIAMDRDGAVQFMNPSAEALTGLSREEAAGKPSDAVFQVTKGRFHSNMDLDGVGDAAKASGDSSYLLLIPSNGAAIPVDASAAPIRDENGSIIGSVMVFRDMTERRRFEGRLRLLSQAVEQSLEGIAIVDTSGKVAFSNRAFAAMHGYTPEEVVGRHLSIFHSPEQLESVESFNRQIPAEGTYRGEVWHTRKDGTVFPGLMHKSLLRDDQGNVVAMLGTLLDITDIKATEEALRTSHEQLSAYSSELEAKVEERTRDLELSREELKTYSTSLEKTNEALRIIIESIEEQKKEAERKVTHNLNLTVTPILDQLKSQELPETVAFLVRSLEFNLKNVFSSFGVKIVEGGHLLSPREIRICEMIRSGLTSKEIARVMDISPQTVLVHRKNIRRKLALGKSKQNLASFLKANL